MSDDSEYNFSENLPAVQETAMIAVEQSRAVQEVQAALVIAKKFPRDLTKSFNDLMEVCKRPSFAKSATYSYPKGGQTVSDGSIRLAEAMVQCFGNLDAGVRELSKNSNSSECESYCWDMQRNTKIKKVFTISHEVWAKGNMKRLTDPRDIYEHVANQGARRLRACIFATIPPDFKEEALKQVRKTLADANAKRPIGDVIREMVGSFKSNLQVTQEMIETRLGHSVESMNLDELTDFQGIFNSLRDNQTKRSDWFGNEKPTEPEKGSLNEKLKMQAAQNDAVKAINKSAESVIKPALEALSKEIVKKDEPAEKSTMEVMAGQLKITEWPKYKDSRIKEVPEDELLEYLTKLESEPKISDNAKMFYQNACVWLRRKQDLKK